MFEHLQSLSPFLLLCFALQPFWNVLGCNKLKVPEPKSERILRIWGSNIPAQASNAAFKKTVHMSSNVLSTPNTFAPLTVDMKTSELCNAKTLPTDKSPLWQVDLGASHVIYGVTITKCTEDDAEWSDFNITVLGYKSGEFTQCAGFTGRLPKGFVVDIPCRYPVAGRHLQIYKHNKPNLSMLEVQVWAYKNDISSLRNVALGKPAKHGQGSTGMNPGLRSATLATDGAYQKYNIWGAPQCTHTGYTFGYWGRALSKAWLIIDLEGFYSIHAVVVSTSHLPYDAPESLGAEVYLQDPFAVRNSKGSDCYRRSGKWAQASNITLYCYRPVTGRYVRLHHAKTTLSVCEVQVLGIPHHFQSSRNIALRKPVSHSSKIGGYQYAGPQYAVNGIAGPAMSVSMSLKGDQKAWLLVDLEMTYSVRGVKVVSGNDAFALVDFDVWTSVMDPQLSPPWSAKGRELCHHFTGKLGQKDSVALPCVVATAARYVQVTAVSTMFSVSEIEVYGAGPIAVGERAVQVTHVSSSQTIDWNTRLGPVNNVDCYKQYSEARAAVMVDLKENYTLYGVAIASHDFVKGGPYTVDIFTSGTGESIFCSQLVSKVGHVYQEAACMQPIGQARFVTFTVQNNHKLKICYVKYIVVPTDYYQMNNLALNKPSVQSSAPWGEFTSHKVVDGVRNTGSSSEHCSRSADGDPDPWLEVDLREEYEVHGVVVRSGNSSEMQEFDIHVSNQTPTQKYEKPRAGVLCRHHSSHAVTRHLEILHCHSPVKGRYVRVNTHDGQPLHLCELEVLGKVNVS